MQRGGPVKATVVPDVKMSSLPSVVFAEVEQDSYVSTDEMKSYNLLNGDGCGHGSVKHSAKEWQRIDTATGERISANGIANFWRQLKVSVKSMHCSVSSQHTAKYLGEFTFRMNHRTEVNRMFDRLVAKF